MSDITDKETSRERLLDIHKHSKLEELLQVEENYLADLLTISSFFAEMRRSKEDPEHPIQMPEELRIGRDKIVLGNFHVIRDFHKDVFTETLSRDVFNPEAVRDLFKTQKRQIMKIYGVFVN